MIRESSAAWLWRHRERVELEAAALFDQLAAGLSAIDAEPLATRARIAAADERRHAIRCRALVERFSEPGLPPQTLRRFALGPRSLPRRDHVLYAAVAIGCVTESLSCALLLELREVATDPVVRATLDEIVKDEIEHARIGWAVLADAAARRDVGWLAAYVPAMLHDAIGDDAEPLTDAQPDLSGVGILSRQRVATIVQRACDTVILPGLARSGVHSPRVDPFDVIPPSRVPLRAAT